MPNKLFRDRANTLVETALREARDAAAIDHDGFRGRIREIAVDRLIRPFLPSYCSLGTGKVIDHQGEQSAETDLLIYSPTILPPILYSGRDGLFPLEACLYALEIKSKVTAKEVRDTVTKFRRLRTLKYSSGEFSETNQPIAHEIHTIVPVLLGFTSDLSASGRSEIERYGEIDADWESNPAVRVLCVAGRGYWWYAEPFRRWVYQRATEEHDEVVNFLSGVVNTIPDAVQSRRHPRLGNYLITNHDIGIVGLEIDAPVSNDR